LDAQLGRYADLPRRPEALHTHFTEPNAADAGGKFTRVNGQLRFTFGKYRGQPLDEIARTKPDYLEWILAQDFFDDAKKLVRQALERAKKGLRLVNGAAEEGAARV